MTPTIAELEDAAASASDPIDAWDRGEAWAAVMGHHTRTIAWACRESYCQRRARLLRREALARFAGEAMARFGGGE